ncbi:Translocase of chloroplast 90 [Hibiscus syriacus]|uniref:Translocase of chloroplast 90 n=1 Tax=Hibiscus syriacus TaxID=106335 RepID=A0A6A3CQ48_HIBSY|nr:translocase of chloroplast 90, chloroplastic-like [Hibiscus syriacus]XP_039027816.1 translocase of chloroplast 90, chloroplastic-like [Hibiscus syriacus]XP_039027821.1 translocase of chloroplast 90, chloroplastic-like [Hibiscus syriacus]KAE8730757.1 Translocase of chloroplast 90 [Hibiscus syriacus]
MKGIRDWVFTQVLASSRPLSGSGGFFPEAPSSQEFESEDQGSSQTSSSVALSVPPYISSSSGNIHDNDPFISRQQVVVEGSNLSHSGPSRKKMDPLAKIEKLQITFLRLLQRLGQPHDNLLVAKVLYRMHLATLIRAGESDLKRVNLRNERAKTIAREREASGLQGLDFSIKILVLGKTGVGKSATINSVFDQPKTETSAFQPATDCIREVTGTVHGIKVTFIDTPGFLPSSTSTMRRNRKIMLSVKKFIRRSPPDVVLYFERLDLLNMGYSDFPLLKLMTEVFGNAIWFNTILVMTHSSSALPEGPNGYPVNYESYVNHCTDLVQQYIHLAVSDSRLENPLLLVENDPQCKRNFIGQSILPNGQVWKSRFFLLCICTKVLGDANKLLEFKDSNELGQLSNNQLPSLPHLLSTFLQHRSVSNPAEPESELDEILLSEEAEEEYDQLPSIQILTKSQFKKLTKSLKKSYLDELEYRETLYLKKQLKEECLRRKEGKLSKEKSSEGNDGDDTDNKVAPEAVQLPDMAVPPSFDSDCPIHRYRCLVTNDLWLARPVLDPHGWDHDVGFDGINLETALEVKKKVFASIAGQMSKDKRNFSIHSECAVAYADPVWPTYSLGLDVQSTGKDLMYNVHSNAKLRSLKHNFTDCGLSVTSFRNKYYVGAKLEETILVGKRMKFVMNTGLIEGSRQVAYGGNFEASFRGRDYPVRNDHLSLTMTALSFKKETVLGGGFQSEFRPIRGMRLAINGNINSQKMGQVCVKMSSSDHVEIALVAVFSIFKALLHRMATENGDIEALEGA